MGCNTSVPQGGEGGNDRSNDSKTQTRGAKEAKDDDHVVRMLLLGAGESGKSTIFKQMRILYGIPPNDDELVMYGVVIRSNVITAMEKLVGLVSSMKLEGELNEEETTAFKELHENLIDNKQAVLMEIGTDFTTAQDATATKKMQQGYHNTRAGVLSNQEAVLFLRHVDALKLMWNSVAMKKAWVNRAEANVIDGHKVYLDDMDRIASETFRPTQNDVLLARVRTTAAVKERFKIKGATFEVFDIGGQRGERRKWWEVFDQEMDAVIFVAALSEYDQTLTEARRSNRMIEALELFKSVINNQHFAETPIILFLNKKDIFAEKIQYSHIAAQPPFADYIGPRCDFNAGIEYFSTKFKDCIMDDEMQKNYIETTCATDTNQMDFVLDSTRQIILEYNLKFSGF